MKKRYVKEDAVESWPYSHKPRTPKGSYGILCKKSQITAKLANFTDYAKSRKK